MGNKKRAETMSQRLIELYITNSYGLLNKKALMMHDVMCKQLSN